MAINLNNCSHDFAWTNGLRSLFSCLHLLRACQGQVAKLNPFSGVFLRSGGSCVAQPTPVAGIGINRDKLVHGHDVPARFDDSLGSHQCDTSDGQAGLELARLLLRGILQT